MLRFPAFENQTLKRAEWALASDLALASWLKLATHAALAENGGRFAGASGWDDRAWSIMAGITLAGVAAAVSAQICQWEDDALVVVGYEVKAESIVQARREHGKTGGRPKETARGNQTDNHTDNQTGNRAGRPLSLPLPSLPSLPSLSKADSSELGSADSKPPAFVFPADAVVGTGSGPWAVSHRAHERLVAAYPGVAVSAEYLRALSWLEANPKERKTRSGMPRFLNGWMARGQNVNGWQNGGPPRERLRALPAHPTELDERR